MREATPYVRKGSPVSEISWETLPPESPRPSSPPISPSSDPPSPCTPPALPLNGDRRCILLKMCYVTRGMTTPDPENRYGEAPVSCSFLDIFLLFGPVEYSILISCWMRIKK